jgi:hypothetical protein
MNVDSASVPVGDSTRCQWLGMTQYANNATWTRCRLSGFFEDVFEHTVVVGAAEYQGALGCAVDNVVGMPMSNESSSPWHIRSGSNGRA